MSWLVLSDDAHVYAGLASAALAGQGFPNAADQPVLGVSELLFLHLVTFLHALGLPALAAVWVVNIAALLGVLALMWRWRGWRGALLALAGLALTEAVLVSAGLATFLATALAAAVSYPRAGGGVWAGLAVAARPESALALLWGGLAGKAKGRRWLGRAALPLAAVGALSLWLWGSAFPETLGARQALLERLAVGGAAGGPLWPWAALPALALLAPGWRPGEQRLLATAALMGVAWLALGAGSGAAFFLVGGLCWLALAARAARGKTLAVAAVLLAGLATFPLARGNQARWQDHHAVASAIAASLPAAGCTLAYWYLGYLRTHTDACILDGSGVFNKEALAALRQAGTGDVLVHSYGDRLAAVLQFHPGQANPLPDLYGFPATALVEGQTITAVLYERAPP